MARLVGDLEELTSWMEQAHDADRTLIKRRLLRYGSITLPAAALEREGLGPVRMRGYAVAEYCTLQMLTKLDRFLCEVRSEDPDPDVMFEHLQDFRNYALMADRAIACGGWPALRPLPQ